MNHNTKPEFTKIIFVVEADGEDVVLAHGKTEAEALKDYQPEPDEMGTYVAIYQLVGVKRVQTTLVVA